MASSAGVKDCGFRTCREEFLLFPCLYEVRFCALRRAENWLTKIAQAWLAAAWRATQNSGTIIVISGIVVSGCTRTVVPEMLGEGPCA
jgi:hypothetical protein